MVPLVMDACNKARALMNKMPPLACAAFDECLRGAALLSPTRRPSSDVDELKEYALEYMRENSVETLRAQGTQFLSAASIEAVICDQEMDVDETAMFKILSSWVKQDEDNIEDGRRLVSNIKLCYMKPDHLKYVVKKCGFVEAADVDAALEEIEEALANESPEDKEHVLVQGAGQEGVDGIYVRMEEDLGMGREEVMFVKEGAEEDDYGPDHNLFLLRSTWAITLSADSSNTLYSHKVTEGSLLHRAPKYAWLTIGGEDPSPTCTWSPSKADRLSGKGYVAPNIANAGLGMYGENCDHDDGRAKRMTLRTMMSLPVDEEHADDDYCGSDDDSVHEEDL